MTGRPEATWRMPDQLASSISKLRHLARERTFRAGEHIYGQGELSSSFYVVVAGLVQISIVRIDGVEIVLEKMGPDTICGEAAAFAEFPNFSSAVAIEPTTVLEFAAGRLPDLFREHPDFALALLRLTSLKQRVLALRLEHMVSNNPEERVLELLTRLGQMFGTSHAKGNMVRTRLTHEMIAAMTGVSRVTVTRTLKRMRQSGSLHLDDGFFVISPAYDAEHIEVG
ncbi:MAG: Crp/Fnr family transcriptional regulator [Silicimonas sp.]|jgi:CRP/FNR family cyclic AMP-dependent transcriptional regulator|uniref:Crp/Fnr family transcriptional regulator n=1 Tax=Roseitalea porphyridii TaxID=1852022 RepID=UPI000584F6B1